MLYMCFDTNNPPAYAMQGYWSATPWFFFIMVWYGYLFLSGIDIVEEYILILQINSRLLYALSKILFLVTLSVTLSIVGCIFPAVIHLGVFTPLLEIINFFNDKNAFANGPLMAKRNSKFLQDVK